MWRTGKASLRGEALRKLLILQSKQEQTRHEHDYAEKLIFRGPFTVYNHAKHHYDQGVTSSKG